MWCGVYVSGACVYLVVLCVCVWLYVCVICVDTCVCACVVCGMCV